MTLNEWTDIHHNGPVESFLREAREKNLIRRLDSHTEIFSFLPGIYSFRMEGNPKSPPVWAYLIAGDDAAMLIDTGYGVGDISGAVYGFIGTLPLYVINTHVHGDHVSGDFEFPRVYVNEHEADILRETLTPETAAQIASSGWVLPEDYTAAYAPCEIITFSNGKTFGLGEGHEIEMIEVPGHTAGSTVVLDRKNRVLFSSDTVLLKLERVFEGPGLDELRALEARRDEFDWVFPGHGAPMLSPKVVTDTLRAVERMNTTPGDYDFTIDRFGKNNPVFVSGDAGLIYLRKSI